MVEHLDDVAHPRAVTQHHLEPVEFRWIMRARDLNPAVHLQSLGREVERGRRDLADVDRDTTRRHDARADTLRELAARRPVVSPNGHARRLTVAQPIPRKCRIRLPDGACGGGRELLTDDAANVVLAKDCGGKLHAVARDY